MSLDGFVCAGQVLHRGLNLDPLESPPGRLRHAFGGGPFARLVMPPLPAGSGLYIWQRNDTAMYLGQTRTPLAKRLGSNDTRPSRPTTRSPGSPNGRMVDSKLTAASTLLRTRCSRRRPHTHDLAPGHAAGRRPARRGPLDGGTWQARMEPSPGTHAAVCDAGHGCARRSGRTLATAKGCGSGMKIPTFDPDRTYRARCSSGPGEC